MASDKILGGNFCEPVWQFVLWNLSQELMVFDTAISCPSFRGSDTVIEIYVSVRSFLQRGQDL